MATNNEALLAAFKKTRAAAQSQMVKQSNGKKFYSNKDELHICKDTTLGMTFGVFLTDANNIAYRIINGYRTFRINEEVAKKYGITNYELRICDSGDYLNISEDDKKRIDALKKCLEGVQTDWDTVWANTGIARFKPSWNKHMTIQFMKVARKTDASGSDVKGFEPGVKVLMAKSDAYFRAFDSYIEDQSMATGDMASIVTAMLSRDERVRSQQYMIKVTRPTMGYEVSITALQKVTELTDDDLRASMDLNKAVVDITEVNSEELKAWLLMFKETKKGIKKSVMGTDTAEETVAGATEDLVPSAPESEPVKEEIPEEDEDNPFI